MKRFFWKGLGALLPLLVTLWIITWVFGFLYNLAGVPIGNLIHYIMVKTGATTALAEGVAAHWIFPAMGFVVGFILILILGFLVATFLGKKLMKLMEWALTKVPFIRVIYPYAKQFIAFFTGDEKEKRVFKTPVALPFPAPGILSIGFITSDGLKVINEHTGKHHVCIFVPTSPTPFTGYIVYVPREDVIPLPITVDEAMRMFISAGVLAPPHQVATLADFTKAGAMPLPESMEKSLGIDKKS